MIVLALFSWWYGRGWSGQVARAARRVQATLDYFSVSLLAKTLFDPFKQIDAAPASGGLKRQAAFDQLFSRLMGFVVRSSTIVVGFISAFAVGIFSLVQLILWPIAPVAPLVGLVLTVWGSVV